MVASPINFLRFSMKERLLFPEAIWSLVRSARMVKRVAYAQLEKQLPPSKQGVPDARQQERAAAICRVVRSAARHLPFECACLEQGLAARAMLWRRGIPCVLHIGVARGLGEGDDPGLDSHAWLSVGERVLTGREGYERFSEVVRF